MATTPIIAKQADAKRQTEELADVVIAVESRDRRGEPWYVRLRAWLFCLMFLCVAECGTRIEFDTTLCLHHERFDNFPNPAALDAFVGQIKRDPAFRVVVLGDSVVVGPSLLDKDETIPEYLEVALRRQHPGRDIHVWNLGIAGARSADIYCVLLKVLEASPDLLVIENNFMMYAVDFRGQPISNTWLAYSLPHIPAALTPFLKQRDYKRAIEDTSTWFVERNFRLFGLRQAINGMLFGVQPRVPFEDPNPVVMLATVAGKRVGKLPMQSWSRRGQTADSYRSLYLHGGAGLDPVRPNNLNGRFYPIMMEELRKRKVPAFFYMTPQNPAMLAQYFPNEIYVTNRGAAATFTSAPDFPSRDYSTLVPDQLFYDNDHLLADGNRMVAEAIAKDIQPLLKTALAPAGKAAQSGSTTVSPGEPERTAHR
jgi:lysophospholipase L1-like esterase